MDLPDPRLVPPTTYRNGRERYHSDGGGPGRYERPVSQGSNSVQDHAKPSLERASYPELPAPRPEASDSPPRVWNGNTRGGKPPKFSNGRGRYANNAYDHRPAVPRSWDREDAPRTRPPPEVYPPPDATDRELYTVNEYRERRVRGRSPSMSGFRGEVYSGPPEDVRPAKRARDEEYYDDYASRYSNYYGRPSSPGFYDARAPYPPDDDYDSYFERSRPSDVAYYDRRPADVGGAPLPPYRGKVIYSRPDLDDYNGIPPRTA